MNQEPSKPRALILIADGTEEMEFTITYDTLVRGGFECRCAFVKAPQDQLHSLPIATCSRGVKIVADVLFEPGPESSSHSPSVTGLAAERFGPENYDVFIIPGGAKGAETMSNDKAIQSLTKQYLEKGKYVGMICAGSLVAKTANLPSQPITSHPSVKKELESMFDYSENPVVVSGKLVTTRGPGSTFAFALTLIQLIQGKDVRSKIVPPMMFPKDTPWSTTNSWND